MISRLSSKLRLSLLRNRHNYCKLSTNVKPIKTKSYNKIKYAIIPGGLLVWLYGDSIIFEQKLNKDVYNGTSYDKIMIPIHKIISKSAIDHKKAYIMSNNYDNKNLMYNRFLNDYPIEFEFTKFLKLKGHKYTCSMFKKYKQNLYNNKCSCKSDKLIEYPYNNYLTIEFIKKNKDKLNIAYYIVNNMEHINYIPENILEKYVIRNKNVPNETIKQIMKHMSKQRFTYNFVKNNIEYIYDFDKYNFTQKEWIQLIETKKCGADSIKKILLTKLKFEPVYKDIIVKHLDVFIKTSNTYDLSKAGITQDEVLNILKTTNSKQIKQFMIEQLKNYKLDQTEMINIINMTKDKQERLKLITNLKPSQISHLFCMSDDTELLNILYEHFSKYLNPKSIMNKITKLKRTILINNSPYTDLYDDINKYIIENYYNNVSKLEKEYFWKKFKFQETSLQYISANKMDETDFKNLINNNPQLNWKMLTNLKNYNDINKTGEYTEETLLKLYKFNKNDEISDELIEKYSTILLKEQQNMEDKYKQKCVSFMDKKDIISYVKSLGYKDPNTKNFYKFLTIQDIIDNNLIDYHSILIEKYEKNDISIEELTNILTYYQLSRNINGISDYIINSVEYHIYNNPTNLINLIGNDLVKINTFLLNININNKIKKIIIEK